jgi:hypothetical protein
MELMKSHDSVRGYKASSSRLHFDRAFYYLGTATYATLNPTPETASSNLTSVTSICLFQFSFNKEPFTMVATKLLFVAMAAYVAASPVASAPAATTTDWTALAIPEDSIAFAGIDNDALKNPANWKQHSYANEIIHNNSSNPANVLAGPCNQGTCPDYSAGFDLVYTFVAVPSPGDPPLTDFSSNSDIRVNDCNQCLRKKVGSSLGGDISGGCYDFNACGREQSICVDPGKSRAHRIWKGYVKTCYKMKVEYLGGCGLIKSRIVLHPDGEVPCNWR